MLVQFNMIKAKHVNTLLIARFLLLAAKCTIDAVEKVLTFSISYESALDNLMYLMVCTRMDIGFVAVKVSRYMSNLDKVR